jgi:ribose transport system ATP-binding protein
VLRNGEVVGYPDRDLLQNTDALIAMMVGREIDQLYTPRQRGGRQWGPAALGAPAERRAAAAGSYL